MDDIVNNILLSHHLDDELDNCVAMPCGRRRYYMCVRCFSAIVATVLTIPVHIYMPNAFPPLLLLLAFPDWILRRFRIWRGNNFVRALSGILLGTAYSLNLVELFSLQFRMSLWCANMIAVGAYVVTLIYTWPEGKTAITKR